MFSVDPQEGTVPLGTLLVVLLWSLPLIGAGRSENMQSLSGRLETEITLSLFSLIKCHTARSRSRNYLSFP